MESERGKKKKKGDCLPLPFRTDQCLVAYSCLQFFIGNPATAGKKREEKKGGRGEEKKKTHPHLPLVAATVLSRRVDRASAQKRAEEGEEKKKKEREKKKGATEAYPLPFYKAIRNYAGKVEYSSSSLKKREEGGGEKEKGEKRGKKGRRKLPMPLASSTSLTRPAERAVGRLAGGDKREEEKKKETRSSFYSVSCAFLHENCLVPAH